MALLDSTPQIGLTTYTFGFNGLYYVGQSIYGQNALVDSVQFRLGGTSTPTSGYLQAFIYESLVGDIANVNARPSSTSNYVAASTQRSLPLGLGSSVQNIEFVFPTPFELEEDKEYVVGLQYIKDTYDQYMSVQVLSTQHPGNYSAQRTNQSSPTVVGAVDLYFELYGELIPDGFTGTKDQLGRGRVSKLISTTRASTSRISKVFSAANTSSARISKQVDISQYGVASIANKVLSTDLIEITFVDGTVYAVDQTSVAKIIAILDNNQTSVARITRMVASSQPSVGRLQKIFTQSIETLSRIVKSITSAQYAVARLVKELNSSQTSQARIQWVFGLIQESVSRVSKILDIQQSAKARLVKELSKTQTGIAAIRWILGLEQHSRARVSKLLSLTTTAKAQIAKEFNRTIVGRAWLAFIASIEQPSLSTIQKTLELNQPSQSYIGTAYEQIVIGKDETYTVGQTPVQDFIPTGVESDNIYGIGVVQKDSYREIAIDNNNTYEVVEHDGI